ncbi:MAG: sulfatase [bacterium]|nr:sulfatase [bacterium]
MSVSNKANLIIINCHDIGQHISPYGVDTVNTPGMQQMAEEGVTFTNSFCTSPGCSPSRAAIFTGRYPHSTGVLGLTHSLFLWHLNDDEVHLAQFLGANGYHTALCGGFHEDRDAARCGYEEIVHGSYVSAHEAATAAEEYLVGRRSGKEPFYLCVGLFEPHRSFGATGAAPYDEKGVYIPGYIPQDDEAQKAAAYREFAALQGAINYADNAVERILQAVRANGFENNTVIIFTGDHGIAMPRAKCTLYDPGIEVPFIVKAPCWGLEAGTRLNGFVSNVDYFPTIVEGLGLEIPARVEGKSCFSYLRGEGNRERNEIFAEKTYHRNYDPIRCVRSDRYKYIVNFEFNLVYDAPTDIIRGDIYRAAPLFYTQHRPMFELYDLDEDPWELDNLAGKSGYEQVEGDLKGRLFRWMRETDDPLLKGPVSSIYYEEAIASVQKHML